MQEEKPSSLGNRILRIIEKALAVVFIVPVVLAVGIFFLQRYLYSIDYFATPTELEFDKRLETSLANHETKIPLKTLVDFPWKKVCVDQADFHMKLNGERPLGRFQFIDEHDVWHIGFVKQNDEIEFVRILGNRFLPLKFEDRNKCFTNEDVYLTVETCENNKCFGFKE